MLTEETQRKLVEAAEVVLYELLIDNHGPALADAMERANWVWSAVQTPAVRLDTTCRLADALAAVRKEEALAAARKEMENE